MAGDLFEAFRGAGTAVVDGHVVVVRPGGAVAASIIDQPDFQLAGEERGFEGKIGDIAIPVGLGVVGDAGGVGDRRIGSVVVDTKVGTFDHIRETGRGCRAGIGGRLDDGVSTRREAEQH